MCLLYIVNQSKEKKYVLFLTFNFLNIFYLVRTFDIDNRYSKKTIRANWFLRSTLKNLTVLRETSYMASSRGFFRSDELSAGKLAFAVNALTFACQNPRDFYGEDLVQQLTEWVRWKNLLKVGFVPTYFCALQLGNVFAAKKNFARRKCFLRKERIIFL